jgi:hypothetical protein
MSRLRAKPIAVQRIEQEQRAALMAPLVETPRSLEIERLLNRIRSPELGRAMKVTTLEPCGTELRLAYQENTDESGSRTIRVTERIFLPRIDKELIKVDRIIARMFGEAERAGIRKRDAVGRVGPRRKGLSAEDELAIEGLIDSRELRGALTDIARYYSRINRIRSIGRIHLLDPTRHPGLSMLGFDRFAAWYSGIEDADIYINALAMFFDSRDSGRCPLLAVTMHEWLHHFFSAWESEGRWDPSPKDNGYGGDHTEEFVRLERAMGIRW